MYAKLVFKKWNAYECIKIFVCISCMPYYATTKEAFGDVNVGFIGKMKMLEKINNAQISIGDSVSDFYKTSNIIQQYSKHTNPKSFLKITGKHGSFQIDVMYMPLHEYLKRNDNNEEKPMTVILVLIHILSRKAFLYQMRNNKKTEICKAFIKFVEDLKALKFSPSMIISPSSSSLLNPRFEVMGDFEFRHPWFDEVANKNGFLVVYTHRADDDHFSKGDKLGIIDRFVGVFKKKVMMYIDSTGKCNITNNDLKALVENYNNTPHSSLNKQTPNKVFANSELMDEIRNQNARHNNMFDAHMYHLYPKVGDYVRYLLKRNKLQKDGPKFSSTVHKIESIDHGHRYKLKGRMKRLFKYHELIVVSKENINFEVDKDGEIEVATQEIPSQQHSTITTLRKEQRHGRQIENAGLEVSNQQRKKYLDSEPGPSNRPVRHKVKTTHINYTRKGEPIQELLDTTHRYPKIVEPSQTKKANKKREKDDQEAILLNNAHIAREYIDPKTKKPRIYKGKITYIGSKKRPYYFRVDYPDDPDDWHFMTLAEVKKYLQQ